MLKRQSAFEQPGMKMLKGGLHCHTTRSDGRVSPEETIRMHVQNGYDFLAITDHRKYNYTNFAPEEKITIIPGMEFDALFENGNGFRCFHTVCIGPDDGTNGFAQDETFESGKASNQQEYQPYLDWLHENKNLTVYCHPEWSGTPARYFDQLKGNFAMEIWNSGSAISCGMDMNAAYWDELLGQGQKIFGVATDDGHKDYDHCNGWVMVRAENNVSAILTALSQGDFYSSCGPQIYDFYVEDNVAHVRCDPCSQVQFISERHPTRMVCGDGLTEASMELTYGGKYDYVRVSIVDAQGHRAWTNPIFLK